MSEETKENLFVFMIFVVTLLAMLLVSQTVQAVSDPICYADGIKSWIQQVLEIC